MTTPTPDPLAHLDFTALPVTCDEHRCGEAATHRAQLVHVDDRTPCHDLTLLLCPTHTAKVNAWHAILHAIETNPACSHHRRETHPVVGPL